MGEYDIQTMAMILGVFVLFVWMILEVAIRRPARRGPRWSIRTMKFSARRARERLRERRRAFDY